MLTDIEGGFGKFSTPIQPALSLYMTGEVHSSLLPPLPFLIPTNGKITPMNDAMGNNVGKATVLVYPDISEISDDERNKIYEFYVGVGDILKYYAPIDAIKEKELTVEGAKSRYHWKVPHEQIGLQRTLNHIVFGTDDLWFREAISNIQALFTSKLVYFSQTPKVRMVGLGSLRSTNGTPWQLFRPTEYYELLDGQYKFKMVRLVDEFSRNQLIRQSLLLSVLILAIKDYLSVGKTFSSERAIRESNPFKEFIPDYQSKDIGAWATYFLYQHVGSGNEPLLIRHYTGYDIVEQIKHYIGMGISRAYPFLPDTIEAWTKYFKLSILLGFVFSRTKAFTTEVQFVREKGIFQMASERFSEHLQSNYPGFGSVSAPYMPMRFNYLGEDLPFPCSVAMAEYEDEGWKHTNKLSLNRVDKVATFESVEVKNGEVQSNPFEPTADKEKWVKPIIYWDSRIREVQYPLRSTTEWMFPTDHIAEDPAYTDQMRRFLLLLGMMSNAPRQFSDGYRSNHRILMRRVSAAKVSYFLDQWFEVGVQVEGIKTGSNREVTDKEGKKIQIPSDLIPKPGAAAITTGTTQAETPIEPTKIKPVDALPTTTTDTTSK